MFGVTLAAGAPWGWKPHKVPKDESLGCCNSAAAQFLPGPANPHLGLRTRRVATRETNKPEMPRYSRRVWNLMSGIKSVHLRGRKILKMRYFERQSLKAPRRSDHI